MEFKHEALPREMRLSKEGYMYSIINSLASAMINNRFAEIVTTPEASFIGAYAGFGELNKSTDGFRFIVIPKDGKEKEAMQDLMKEIERLDRSEERRVGKEC